MKKLTKRSKILLSIGSLLVILTVAVVVFFQVTGASLSGATGENVEFTPSYVDLIVGGDTVTVSINTTYKCHWWVDDFDFAVFVGPNGDVATMDDTRTVTVKAIHPGVGDLVADCGLFRGTRYYVPMSALFKITPVTAHVAVGETIRLTTNYSGGQCWWYSGYEDGYTNTIRMNIAGDYSSGRGQFATTTTWKALSAGDTLVTVSCIRPDGYKTDLEFAFLYSP